MVLEDILGSQNDIRVVGAVADGEALLAKLSLVRTDVAIIDMDMPGSNCLTTLEKVFNLFTTPVLLLVDEHKLTLELVQQVIQLGVYALIVKPGVFRPNYRSIQDEVLRKVKAVRHSEQRDMQVVMQHLLQEARLTVKEAKHRAGAVDTVFVIGASTGGTQAIEAIVKHLKPDLKAAVLIAVHLPAQFTKSFTRRLQELTPLSVMEGKAGMSLKAGKIIVAPGGRNMVMQSVMGSKANLKVGFTHEPTVAEDQPSVDLLMKSVAESAVKNVIGVILTGMGKDGTLGASLIRKRGGLIIAQDEASSAIFGMAKSAIEGGYIHKVLSLSEIPGFINNYQAPLHEVSLTGGIR